MAQPFFGRREPETLRSTAALPASLHAAVAAPAVPAVSAPLTAPLSAPASADSAGSKLIVGPNIKLKGVEITDCDTLLVEGTVEATMNSRVIEVAAKGAFKGAAEIDIAEIRGHFDGELTARLKLVIHATGYVSGKVRYGKLVIEEGGQLCGDVQCLGQPARATAPTPVKPGLHVAG